MRTTLSPYLVTVTGHFVKNTQLTQEMGKLADAFCNCAFLLPSRNALEIKHHKVNCQYRLLVETVTR
jgi:hypothetical protein